MANWGRVPIRLLAKKGRTSYDAGAKERILKATEGLYLTITRKE